MERRRIGQVIENYWKNFKISLPEKKVKTGADLGTRITVRWDIHFLYREDQ